MYTYICIVYIISYNKYYRCCWDDFVIKWRLNHKHQKVDSHKRLYGRTGWSRWSPSSAGTLGTLLCSGRTGSRCSWASRTAPSSHSPPWWSCSGWSGGACQGSRCHTHRSGPGSSCPRRRWSERGSRQQFDGLLRDVSVPLYEPSPTFHHVYGS